MEEKQIEESKNVPKKTPKIVWWVIGIIVLLMFIFIRSSNNQSSNTTPINQPVSICSGFQSSQARTIDFKQLNKNPDALKGTNAKFTGQIVEIQESSGQGIIRLAVTKDSYGWSFSDIIFVTYTGNNNFVKDDIVTVFGILQGSYTYTSQANFQITLPSMEACSIEKPNTQKVSQTSISTDTTTKKTTTSTKVTTPVPPPAPIIPKSWHAVTVFSGNNEKNTDPFVVKGSQWRIRWSANASTESSYCQEYGCSFYVYVYNTINNSYIDDISADIKSYSEDTSNFYTAGSYYLKISGSNINSWTITIEDYY